MFDTLEQIDKFFVDNFARFIEVVEGIPYYQAVYNANIELNEMFRGNDYNDLYHDCLKAIILSK